MIIAHSNKYCLSLLANPTLSTAMSEKEKEAQVSENETKGENFFFKHECTTVCQKGGATEILDINNFSVNCREVLELGF